MDFSSKALYRKVEISIDSRNRVDYDPLAQLWSGPGTVYIAGDRVFVNAVGYQCIVGHTSTAVFTADLAAGNWNQTRISSPSSYKVLLPSLYRNVKRIAMKTAEVPNTQHQVNYMNQFISFFDNGTALSYNAVIPVGTYTPLNLANAINTAMNAAMGVGFGVNYSATYDSNTMRFGIARLGGPTFSLRFLTGAYGTQGLNRNLSSVVGFTNGYDTGLAAIQYSTTLPNLSGNDYMLMRLQGYPAIASTTAVNEAFAKIILNQVIRNTIFAFTSNDLIFPIAKDKIDSLDVAFFNPDGTLVDFFGADHSFTIELTVLI